ncbi:MAG: hypothetical protein ACYC49_17525, partial [Ignavibacteriaceae bacterium]
KIIINSITKDNGRQVLHPFEDLYKSIFIYYRNSISDIDEYIKNELETFQILLKCSLLKDKVMLYNYQPYNNSNVFELIQKKLNLIDEITSIYLSYGNLILSLDSKLNFVEECITSLQYQLSPGQSQFLKDQMLSSFEKVESEIQPYLNHPEMPPLFLRLSSYSLFLDKKDLAKLYLDRFLELGISINHFSSYIQNYYFSVYNYFYP